MTVNGLLSLECKVLQSHRTAPHHIVSHCIAWHGIASHRIASHRIASPWELAQISDICPACVMTLRACFKLSRSQEGIIMVKDMLDWTRLRTSRLVALVL